MANTIYTLSERPDLQQQISNIHSVAWPRFMLESAVANSTSQYCFNLWPQFQLALCDGNGQVLAAGNLVPLVWDGTLNDLPAGWDAASERGMQDHDAGRVANALSAYSVVVHPEQQRQGHSSTVLKAMVDLAHDHAFHGVMACVRPTLKAQYPLTPIKRYSAWKAADGSPFDPWMRVHSRLGAEQLFVSPRSMEITGTVADWAEWANMPFPESGEYVVPGALATIQISREEDIGRYYEPNVWMLHRACTK
ncbi:MAG: GNAT family N-acetyltransferase [Chloroflexota bacterium]|nr:GNAT family N-acetyltransferase [Chloroflexota bacterium]